LSFLVVLVLLCSFLFLSIMALEVFIMSERLKMPLIVAGIVFVVSIVLGIFTAGKKGTGDLLTILLGALILSAGVFVYGYFDSN